MELAENDARLCREKIAQIDPLFSLTHPYTSGPYADQLLALHALFSSLDEVVCSVSDHFVAQEKLQWWRSELSPGRVDKSRHPLIRYLQNSGAAAKLPANSVAALFQSTRLRLEAAAPVSEEALFDKCEAIYLPRIELETALLPGSLLSVGQKAELARTGGMQLLLLESFVIDPAGDEKLWWLPLSLLARSGLNRHQLLTQLESESSHKLFAELLDATLRVTGLDSGKSPKGSLCGQSDHHLWLKNRLHRRTLGRLGSARPEEYSAVLGRYYTTDVFSLWRLARRLRMKSKG